MYRNPALLALARLAPHCLRCFAPNVGQVVAAHSNQQRDGKGTGIKADDFRVAWLCDACHREIDQGQGDRDWKRDVWEEAHRSTIGWLFRNGFLTVNVEPVEHVNPPKRPSKKIRSAGKIASRPMQSSAQPIPSRPMQSRGFEKRKVP